MKLRNYQVLLLFWGVVQLFYLRASGSGFVTDFTGLQERLAGAPMSGILTSFGFPSLQPFFNLFNYTFYHLFHTNSWGWYLVFSSVHAINAFLLFQWANRLLTSQKVQNTFLIAFFGGLLFLISPYQTEVIFWKVAFNFLLTTFLILNTLLLIEKWRLAPGIKTALLIHLCFILALFTFELSLSIPFLSICYLIWLPGKSNLHQKTIQIILPQIVLLISYFLLTKWIIGGWIGHYGADVHLKMNWNEMFAHVWRYQAKFIFFSRYMDHQWKATIYELCANPIILYPLCIIAGSFILYIFFKKKNQNTILETGTLLWLFFGIALIPVINLFFNFLLWIENDRYGYLASAFFYLFLTYIIFHLPRLLRYSLLTIFLVISLFYLINTNEVWRKSTVLYWKLINTFDAYPNSEVYLLNLPDNLKGAPMFRDFSGEGKSFTDALKYLREKPYDGNLFEITQYNLTDIQDGVQVEKIDSSHIKVTFNQWGNWWWRKGSGATNYSTEQYNFENHGHHYIIELKEPQKDALFLYQDGLNWKIFEMD